MLVKKLYLYKTVKTNKIKLTWLTLGEPGNIKSAPTMLKSRVIQKNVSSIAISRRPIQTI